jgi:hypothetical protein
VPRRWVLWSLLGAASLLIPLELVLEALANGTCPSDCVGLQPRQFWTVIAATLGVALCTVAVGLQAIRVGHDGSVTVLTLVGPRRYRRHDVAMRIEPHTFGYDKWDGLVITAQTPTGTTSTYTRTGIAGPEVIAYWSRKV